MRTQLSIATAIAALAGWAAAQSPAQLKKDLKAKETAAKKDPAALFQVGKWAAQHAALAADANRIFQQVLKLDPEHAGAHEALGNVRVDGKWVAASEAAALARKTIAGEFAGKGLVDIGGAWVEPDKVEDAKKGIFHHDGERVCKAEKLALQLGMVRHPRTGLLIDQKDAEQAANGKFPIDKDRWVDEQEADAFHSSADRPWLVRSMYCTVASTLPLAQIAELLTHADQGYEKAASLLVGKEIAPAHRPVVVIAKTSSEFQEYGTALGDGTDAAGAFLIRSEARLRIPQQGDVRAAVCENHKDWGTRYIRHAAALGYANALAAAAGKELPLWFLHGVGSYTSRFENDADAGWFGKQHAAKGGVSDLRGFFAGFDISGSMEPKEIAFNIYQAGLLLSFAAHGDDARATEALRDVVSALKGQGNLDKAIAALQAALIGAESKVKAHLQALIARSP